MSHTYSTYVQFAFLKEDGVFDLRKIFDLRKFFVVPKNFLKSKIDCITYFLGETPGGLKKKLRAAANALGQELDADLQERIIQEGSNVFKLNNSIIHTIEGVDEIFYKKIFTWLAILALVIGIILALYMKL